MDWSKRLMKETVSELSPAQSRYNFMTEDDTRYYPKNETIENLNSRLATNFTKIVDLFTERKTLLLRKMDRLFEDHEMRIDAISKGRQADIKNQARQLRDENVSALVENGDRLGSIKSLLRRVIEQHNFNQFESMEKVKGKKYYDRLKEVQNDINNRSKKYGIAMEEMEKVNQKERTLLFQIEELEGVIRGVLKRKQGDFVRKAEQTEEEVHKKKAMLRELKGTKDKKKKDLEIILNQLLDTISAHENYTMDRNSDIETLYGGHANSQAFDEFLRQFEAMLELKGEERRDDRKERAVQQLIKMANGYQGYIDQLAKDRQSETYMVEDITDGLKNVIKTVLIEKLYFQEITTDRSKLNEILKRCKAYRNLLVDFDGEKQRLTKELSRINGWKNSLVPKLRSLTNEELRKEELRKELSQLQAYKSQVEKQARRGKESEYMISSYLLTRQAIQREMEECADKGNIAEYKSKLKQLQKLEQEVRAHKDSTSNLDYDRMRSALDGEAQNLQSRYHDLIATVMPEEQHLPATEFIDKLTRRLALI